MKKTLIYSLFFAAIVIFSLQCRKVEPIKTGSLAMNFSLSYDGEDIDLFTDEKPYLDFEILFTRFATFLSDAVFLTDGADYTLFDTELIHFTSGTEERTSIIINDIPASKYTGLELGIGLNSVVNAKRPEDYASGEALNKAEFYWEAWESYIFTKTEGKVTSDDGYTSFAYHTGGDDSYRIARLMHELEIKADETLEMNFNIDLKKIFRKGDSYYNLQYLQSLHNQGQSEDMNTIADNIVQAITVSF